MAYNISVLVYITICCCVINANPWTLTSTPQTCSAFRRFVAQYNPENIAEWVTNNCDKIQPRPPYITCNQILQFARDCGMDNTEDNAGGIPETPLKGTMTDQILPPTLIQAEILPRYMHLNRRTAYDYSAFGNWYYPNYYPTAYINTFMSPSEKAMQFEQDWRWTQGGDYPYQRADNLVNIALQQTIVPTCLHDLPLCIRQLVLAQRYAEAQHYRNYLPYR